MSRKRRISLIIGIFLLIFSVSIIALSAYYANLPEHLSQHETIVLGQSRFVPGSQSSMRVLVRDSKDGAPIPDAEVKVLLLPKTGGKKTLFTGTTDKSGNANVVLSIPEDLQGTHTLVIETQSQLGKDSLKQNVTIQRDYRLLLTTDKPIYQPGQIIHLRALALSIFDLIPARGQEIEFIIADGKGNKVFRKTLTTSEFGVAASDFQLATEVNTGAYKITVRLGDVTTEKTVTVENYVLPKFSVKIQTEKPFYLPGEHIKGSLQADYFFGKPVAGGEVQLEGYTFDVQRNAIFSLLGTTNESGQFEFEFDLPSYIAGSDLEGGLGRFYLQASVTDLAKHTEVSNLSLPVAGSALVIEAIPEGGQFRPFVENILYVLTSYPDGSPAETRIQVTFYDSGQTYTATAGNYGLAELRVKPQNAYQNLRIEARDKRGNFAQREFSFEGEYAEESVLLRPEKPVYQVGESMKLTLLTSSPTGTIYLDIVREGQTMSTRTVDIKNGSAEAVIDLTTDLYGTLELHAYKILRSGAITRDTRLVVVNNADDLSLSINPDLTSTTYKPGDTAKIDFQVNAQDGAGVSSVLGLAIVDESVFALAEQDPGFAKLYFMLESELLVPKYDIHGFSIPELMRGIPSSDEKLITAVENSAQASMSAASLKTFGPGARIFSLQANSRQEALKRAQTLQRNFFSGLSKGLFGLIILTPMVIFGISLLAPYRQKHLGKAIMAAMGLLIVSCLIINLAAFINASHWATSPIEGLSSLFGMLMDAPEGYLLGIMLIGPLSLLVLVIIALIKKDHLLGWKLGLLLFLFLVFALFIYASSRSSVAQSEDMILASLLLFALIPLAFLLRAADFALTKRYISAIFSSLLALFLVLFFVLGFAFYPGAVMSAAPRADFGQRQDVPMIVPLAMATQVASPVKSVGVVEEAIEKPASDTSAAQPPRLRQYFPETMLWIPEATTDDKGKLELDIPIADSITTWRITALASSQDGRLGSTTAGLRVFQDFFIDLDLPLAMTVGDEVSIPVGIFNYLSEAQHVRLEVEQAGWFGLQDEPIKELDIPANDISVVYFRILAKEFGSQPFKVTAWGSKMSDAIQKEVRVFPNGKRIDYTKSDRLTPGQPVQQSIPIPPDVIPGTPSLLVKVYPGILSQVVEGLDSILRMPFGCFEQTSSITYPNVLVLDYLKSTNQVSPETQLKAEEYINLGYQRLTTFEVQSSGGFSLFGEEPADRMLTAYGLQEFSDMSRVHEVDAALIERAAKWLLSQQESDGSWLNDRGLVHETTWANLKDDRLPVTAYIVWSLSEAGFGDEDGTKTGIAYVRENQSKAEDPYVLALVANALVSADLHAGGKVSSTTQTILDRLAGMAKWEASTAYWQSAIATFMGSEGSVNSIETTALAAYAFLRSDTHTDLGNAALTYLIQQKDSFGTWYSTQATVLALKALLQSVRMGEEKANATVRISLNGMQTETLQITPQNFDVLQLVSFRDLQPGKENVIQLQVEGEGRLMYQVMASFYLPWDKLTSYPEWTAGEDLLKIALNYDRTELTVNDTVEVQVMITLNQVGGKAEAALIDLGIPPGFTVLTEDLQALITRFNDVPPDYAYPKIERFELTGRQVLLYITNLSYGNPLKFTYRLQAKYPLKALTPASNAYDYYNPNIYGETPPQLFVVHSQ